MHTMRVMVLVTLIAVFVSSTGCIANMADLKATLGVVPPAAPPPVYGAPVAKAQANATAVKIGAPVRFAADESRDPQQLPLAYLWTFADGTTAATPEATHAYLRPGEYKVILTVTNDKGLADSDSLTVQVAQTNRAPTATMGASDAAAGALGLASNDGALHVMAGDKVAFDSAGSMDPDGDALLVSWDFGDGQTAVGAAPTHAYTEPGRYVATLRVADPSGASAESTRILAVSWTHEEKNAFDATGATALHPFTLAAGARALSASIAYTPGPLDDLRVAVQDASGKELCHAAETGMPAPGASGTVTRGCTLDAAKLTGSTAGAWKAVVTKASGLSVEYTLSLAETL